MPIEYPREIISNAEKLAKLQRDIFQPMFNKLVDLEAVGTGKSELLQARSIEHVEKPKGLMGVTRTMYEPVVGPREFLGQPRFRDSTTLELYNQVRGKYFPKLIGEYEQIQNEFDNILSDLIGYGEGIRKRLIDPKQGNKERLPKWSEAGIMLVPGWWEVCSVRILDWHRNQGVRRQFPIQIQEYFSRTYA